MFKTPFSFEGRIRRLEYGISFIVTYTLFPVAMSTFRFGRPGFMFGSALIVALCWFLFAQGAKRCHDLNKNGWWQLIPFYFILLIFQEGNARPNIYGNNPKDKSTETTEKNDSPELTAEEEQSKPAGPPGG